MATYRRFRVQRKYINGQPTDETRLGEQIDSTDYPSLEECERGSGCTDLEYRWVDVQNEYICEGMNKYTKQRREQRCVGTDEWVAIYPYEYQKGEIMEERSEDCGFSCELDLRFYNWATQKYSSTYVSWSKETISKSDEYFSDPTLLSVFDYCGVVKMVPDDAFYNNHRMDRILLNGCEYIGDGAFKHEPGASKGLQTIEIPSCSYIGDYAFEANSPKFLDISNVEYIGSWAFAIAKSYSSLSGYNSSAGYVIPMPVLSLPKCSYIGEYAFFGHVPESVDLPLVKSLPKYCLWNTAVYGFLTYASLPECERIESSAIRFAGSSIYLPKVSYIMGNPCMQPKFINFGYSGVVEFEPTKLLSGNVQSVRIIVPRSLYDAYYDKYAGYSAVLTGIDSQGSTYKGYYYYSRLFVCDDMWGTLHYSYQDGTQSDVSWIISYVRSANNDGSNAVEIIDSGGIIKTLQGGFAFASCPYLRMVSFPALSQITNRAFLKCSNLTDVYLMSNSVVSFSIPYGVFSGCNSNLKIHIPESLCDDYYQTYKNETTTLAGGIEKNIWELFDCNPTVDKFTLGVYIGHGSGSILVEPSKEYYNRGETITLTAYPAEGQKLSWWSRLPGTVKLVANPTTITSISSNWSYYAHFYNK